MNLPLVKCLDGCVVVRQRGQYYHRVEDVMAVSDVVEAVFELLFWELCDIEHSSKNIHQAANCPWYHLKVIHVRIIQKPFQVSNGYQWHQSGEDEQQTSD